MLQDPPCAAISAKTFPLPARDVTKSTHKHLFSKHTATVLSPVHLSIILKAGSPIKFQIQFCFPRAVLLGLFSGAGWGGEGAVTSSRNQKAPLSFSFCTKSFDLHITKLPLDFEFTTLSEMFSYKATLGS